MRGVTAMARMPASLPWEELRELVRRSDPVRRVGVVTQVVGLTVEGHGPGVPVGEVCLLYPGGSQPPVRAEVVGFRQGRTLLMPLGELRGIGPGCEIEAVGMPLEVEVGPGLRGRVLDGLGRPMDGKGPLRGETSYPVMASAPPPLERRRITEPLWVGVRVIDAVLTCGKGQRVGIFAGSGVGKSVLMGMLARNTRAQVSVIGLVGERGREVKDFLEKDLGPEGLRRSVVVAATSDQPALVRIRAAFVATAIAEYFRDQGQDVLLLMDSVTRFATAQREVGLAIGEPPATRGYTPSVFALLPRLLERSGTSARGSITGIYTVLVEGDDMNEPVADQVRSILDGHIVLSRDLATQGHYPAVDVLTSVSRLAGDLQDEEHQRAVSRLKSVLATYREAEDLINIGAYVPGSNPAIDYARSRIAAARAFLRQGTREKAGPLEARASLVQMLKDAPE